MQPSQARKTKNYSVAPIRRSKGTKIVGIAADIESVQGAPVCPAQAWGRFLPEASSRKSRLVGVIAYDSEPLDEKLASEYGIELIAPDRRGRKHRRQDGRSCAAIEGDGRWSGYLPGCTTSADSLADGSTTSRTSSASSTSPAFRGCSGIYGTASKACVGIRRA
jgi:hypothetical protein